MKYSLKFKFIIISLSLFTNNINSQPLFDLPTDYVRNQVFFVDDITEGQDYEGSPYLNNEFSPGKIIILDKSYSVMLRYNGYQDVFEIKTGENQHEQLVKSSKISVSIGSDKFYLFKIPGEKSTYLQSLLKGSKLNLWIQNKIKFIEAKPAKSSYSSDKLAAFILSKNYFIEREGEMMKLKLKKKELLSLFSDQGEVMKKFIKDNKLSYTEEKDVMRMIQYFNNL